ncbi:MAG: DUF748 domain-containing protein [Syntrophaceae bacterium]|nr:DUF748 domain-containing protein [Syntrophaceae bacterium]
MAKKLKRFYENKLKPRWKKMLYGLIIFFAAFTLIGFFVLPPIFKSILTKQLSQVLHREVTIDQIKINPYALSVTGRGLMIKDRGSSETFASCEEIYLNLQSLSALRLALILKEVRFKKPFIKIVRRPDLSYNFSDIIEKKETVPTEKEKSKPLRFSFNNIKIEDGSMDLFDEPVKKKHTVRELNIGIPFLSNIPSYVQIYVQPLFSAKINDTPYSIQGQTKPFHQSLETSFDININDLNLPYYLAYLPTKTNMKIHSAYLDTQLKISFLQSKDEKPSMTVTGNIALKKIAVDDGQNKPLLRLPLLTLSIAPSEPLTKTFHLSNISVQSPELEISRDEKGMLNVLSLFPETKETKPAPKKEEVSIPFSLDIDEVQFLGGKITFSDRSGSKPFKTILNPIDLKVDHFSNAKDKKAAYALSFLSEAKETFKMEGDFSMEPLGVEGKLEIKSIPLKKYAPYYRDKILFDIEDGRLDLFSRYQYLKDEKEPKISLSGLSLLLSGLRLKRPQENAEFLKIPNLSVKETELDLTKKEIKVGLFSTQKGDVFIKRLKNGEIDILKLTPQPASSDTREEIKSSDKPKEQEKPWLISLKQMSVDNYKMMLEDQTPSEPVTLVAQNLKLGGEAISTAKNSKGKINLSLLFNEKGTILTTGTIGIDPFVADLKMDLKGIEILPLQSYYTDKVNVSVTGGTLSTSGNLSLDGSDQKEFKVTYKGEASLNNLSSLDKGNGEEFLKWESLSLSDLNIGMTPLSIDIKGIALTNFYSRVIINSEGRLNLQEIIKTEEPKASSTPPSPPQKKEAAIAKEKEPSKNIKIGQITLQGGKIDLFDKSVKPEFSTNLSEMAGRISGLSAEENTTADVELRAKLNNYAPLEITGKINPLREDLFVDLKARLKDLDLSPATPYSGKFVGYTIEKGKLSFDLKYLIVKKKLDSQNNIFIDQFTFGDKVESPQATKLPVKLAVALLKDRKGEIKLDLPVTGSLDDPKFSVWGVILKILVNLISKAATSPFSLLGAVFGGGEELSFVEFDYGSTALTETSQKKLETIVKALQDRPALKMDIEGHVDMEKDKDGLKQYLFDRKLKSQKLKEMVKKGQPAIPVDEVKIEKQEYEKYLKMAYKEEKFPKPKNVIGMVKDIPAPEMEKLMMTHIEVQESDLRTLASQRSMRVKEAILKSKQVEPERVFILEPKSLPPEKKEKVKDSRVDFKLK